MTIYNLREKLFVKYRAEIIISLAYFLLAMIFNKYQIVSDGRVYYQVLEQKIFYNLNPQPLEAVYIDAGGGYHQFGASFFWLPFYAIALFLAKLPLFNFPPVMVGKYYVSIYTIFVNLADNFYTLFTLFLGFRILKLYKFKIHRKFAILATFLSTPLFIYSTSLSSFNHAVDTFVLTLLIYLFLLWKDKNHFFQVLIGAIISVSILIRYLNVSIFVYLLFYYTFQGKIKYAKYLLFGFLSTIWLLPLTLYLINGFVFKPFILTLGAPALRYGSFNSIPKYSLKLLLHPIHGLFIWSPLTILSFCGLIHYYQEDKKTATFFIGIFLSLVLLQGCFYNWDAGWSFSQRYLTGMFAVFLFGFAYYLHKFPRSGLIMGIIFTAYTLFLLMNWGTVIHGEFGTPIDMVQAWVFRPKVSIDLIRAKISGFLPFL